MNAKLKPIVEEIRSHAVLSASGSSGWINCAGIINACRGLPDTSSGAAEEGTVYHKGMDLSLVDNLDPRTLIGKALVPETPDLLFNGEMADFAADAIARIHELGAEEMLVEQRVSYERWAPGGFGTADVILFVPLDDGTYMLVVWDHKYGKGVKVFAERNTQQMLYALGVMEEFGWMYEISKVRMIIDQPRLDHNDEWDSTPEELYQWADEVVAPAAELALSEDAPRTPGAKQCLWCRAKGKCKAHAEWVLNSAVDGFEDLDALDTSEPLPLKNADDLSGQDVADLLPHIDSIIKWAKGLEAHAQSELEAGREVPGYKIVEGRSNRRWADEEAAEKFLRRTRRMKMDECFTRKLITAPQAEKILGKNDKRLQQLIEKPKGKPSLALASDKRPALEPSGIDEFDALD